MNLEEIYATAPWDWPEDADKIFFDVLGNPNADPAQRLLAAEMAGNSVVANDKLAQALLAIVENGEEAIRLRSQAAISLGPALEHAYLYEFDDPDDMLLTKKVFLLIQAALEKIYHDANFPKDVRRSILEASIRAPQEWHQGAVRAAYQSDDEEWQLTAVFCMGYSNSFEPQILEALESSNPVIHYQAVISAGNQGIEKAWPHIAELLSTADEDLDLLFAAIEAAVNIGHPEAWLALGKLLDSENDDIIDATHEALAMLEAFSLPEDDE